MGGGGMGGGGLGGGMGGGMVSFCLHRDVDLIVGK